MIILNQRLKLNGALRDVQRPGRYTGWEYNSIRPDPFADFRFCLFFPDVYDIGVSYHGFSILYHILNRIDGVSCERAYLPWVDMQVLLQKSGTPLFSVESGRSLKEFDAIGITLQTELHYTGVVKSLDLAGIPRRSTDRDKSQPIIIGGGPCAFHPEPIAPFFDAFLLGDGEEALSEIVDLMRSAVFKAADRCEQRLQLAKIKGTYVPGLYDLALEDQASWVNSTTESAPRCIRARVVPVLKPEYYPLNPIVPSVRGTHDRLTVEIMRGCTQGCRFCQAGMLHRPVRERGIDDIVDQVVGSLDLTGWDEIGLLSLSTSDYSHLDELLKTVASQLGGMRASVTFPSLRPSTFTETMAEIDLGGRKTGVTFAVEAGSQRLRDAVNKGLTDEELIEAVARAWRLGWKTVKLYFMVGLPTEHPDDIDEGARLLDKIQRLIPRRRELHISVAPFIPKPHSVFARETFLAVDDLNSRIHRLFSRISHRNVKVSWHNPRMSRVEALLARGDRRLAAAVERVANESSCLDGWSTMFNADLWQRALDGSSFPWQSALGSISDSQPTPWDHLQKGLSKRFLREDLKAAHAGRTVPDCRDGDCYKCGLMRECEDVERAVASFKHEEIGERALGHRVGKYKISIPTASSESKVYRLYFNKLRSARYLGHHDLMTAVLRGLRRAKLPQKYSQGYNPRPRVTYPPALALGIGAQKLWIELETLEELETSVTMSRLRKTFPPGVRPIALEKVAGGKRIMARTYGARIFRLRFNRGIQLTDDNIVFRQFQNLGLSEREFVNTRTLWFRLDNSGHKIKDVLQALNSLIPAKQSGSTRETNVISITQMDGFEFSK